MHRRPLRSLTALTLASALALSAAAPAQAQDAPPPAGRAEFTGVDWTLGVLAGDAGTLVGFGVPILALLGCRAAGPCEGSSAYGTLAAMLAVTGGAFGNSLGTWMYGEAAGFDGSWWWTLLGSFGGMLAYGTFAGSFKDAYHPAAIAALAVFPALGSTAGYWYSLDDAPGAESPPRQLSSALLSVDGDAVRWGLPAPAVAPDGDGGLHVLIPLVAGRR